MTRLIPTQVLSAEQSQGLRDHQEDAFGAVLLQDSGERIVLLVLADGMGGHVAGATASSIAVDSALNGFEKSSGTIKQRLLNGLELANSTLVLAALSKAGLEWISVGDSPLWLITASGITRLNEDHSMKPVYEDMVATGRMTIEDFEGAQGKHALRSGVSGEDIHLIDTVDTPLTLIGDEMILLASDGLETLDLNIIAETAIMHTADMRSVTSALLARVSEAAKPDQDNTSIVALQAAYFTCNSIEG